MSSVSNSYIKQVLKHVKFIVDHRSIKRELRSHINDLIEEHNWQSLSNDEINNHIMEEMGNPDDIGKELNKIHHPIIGYVWVITRAIFIVILCLSLYNVYQSFILTSQNNQMKSDENLDIKSILNAIGYTNGEDISNVKYRDWDIREVVEIDNTTIVFERVLLLDNDNLVLLYRTNGKFNFFNQYSNIYMFNSLKLNLNDNKEYPQDINVQMWMSGLVITYFNGVPYETNSITLNFKQVSESFDLSINGDNYE
ncbi:MAG TPA: hypothetical protein VFH18_03730 [Erysipelotrichaceae bacterium]|nr:hypothetical protein [Erysipelotrichaceae bacterium]